MPWFFSSATEELLAWHTGPVIPGLRPMWLSLGSGQVSAVQPAISRHVAIAFARSIVHCLPNGGGCMHPAARSCISVPPQPMESCPSSTFASSLRGVPMRAERARAA